MYTDHYHLKTKPFDLSPGSHFIWLGEKHNEALATLNYGILEDLGFLLLTGDVGVGKTALIHRLIGNLDSSTIVAHITDPGLGTLDFFKLLAVEFNISSEFKSKGEFLIELEKFLYKAHADRKKVLLIVDEAQRLNHKLLDQIRVLSNIELSDRKLINIFFVGQPEFKNMLMDSSNRAIRQRIAINYHIKPLRESETGQYIEHRLMVAGATRKIFKPDALREVFRVTDGYPRAINILCDHALVTGYASGLQTIDANVIKECEQELNIRAGFDLRKPAIQPPHPPTRPETPAPSPPRRLPSMWYPLLLGLGIVLMAFFSYDLIWPAPRLTMQLIDQLKSAVLFNDPTDTVVIGKIEKDQTQAASEPDLSPAQPDPENSTQAKQAPKDEITTTDRPTAIFSGEASPAPDRLAPKRMVDSGVTAPVKSEKNLDLLPAASDTEPGIQADETTPAPDPSNADIEADSEETVPVKAEENGALAPVASGTKPGIQTNEPTPAPDPSNADIEADSEETEPVKAEENGALAPVASGTKPGIPTDEATPAPKPSAADAGPEVDSGVTLPAKAEKNVALVAVIPDVQPKPPPDQSSQLSDASGKSETGTPASEETNGSTAAAPKIEATATPSTPTIKKSSKAAVPDKPNQTKQAAVPEEVASANRSGAPIVEKPDPQLQASIPPMGSTRPSDQQTDINSLENRLRSFLQNYCNAYAAKDFDAFTNFFIPDARENGEPFIRLLPKYQKNFSVIETIQYRIELGQFSYDEDREIVTIDGLFFLKWLPPDQKWRENEGSISMSLREKGPSFLIQRLDYQGNATKKN